MKKILVVSPGILPVPAIMGGAVEYLTELYINDNEENPKFKYDLATIVYDKKIIENKQKYNNTNYIYINGYSIMYKISRAIRFILNKNPKYYFNNAYIHRVVKKLKKDKKEYDLILIENNPLYVKSIRRIFPNTKIILHLHNDYLNPKSKHNKYILENCYKVLTVSNYIGDRVKQIYKTSKVETLYNGIEVERFDKTFDYNTIVNYKKRFGIQQEDFVILYAGRLTKEKGILELIYAFKEVIKKHKNIKLLIVGSKNFEAKKKDRFTRKLYSLSKEMQEKIIFTGFINYSEMPVLYKISNISVVPSHWGEPLATTVIEGLLSGIPQIVTNDGGIPEEVKGTNAVVIDKNNLIEELTDGLENVISNYEKFPRSENEDSKKRFCKERYIMDLKNILIMEE